MKNQFKNLLILLIIMVLTFFNVSNNAYAQSCDDLRPCQANSDCLNNGFCQDLGNSHTRCHCQPIVKSDTFGNIDYAQEDYPYGKHCENVFMCGECSVNGGYCFYFAPETEEQLGYNVRLSV